MRWLVFAARAALQRVSDLVATLLIGMVRIYKILVSPLLGQRCRFQPTCSQYFVDAVRKYGPLRGTLKGIWRIVRCNPWNPGGEDPA